MSFREDYLDSKTSKESILCMGLDPALPGQRSQNTIPDFTGEEAKAMLEFCLEMIEEASDYCCAVKPNSQYLVFALTARMLRKLNKKIHSHGMISILDHKLSDIGSSNESAIYWIKKTGFDAFTYAPYPGNIRETISAAAEKKLGVFTLSLMSNPQSGWIQKNTIHEGKPLFLKVAGETVAGGGDGLVVGATGTASLEDIARLRETTGGETIYLVPGIGAQGGSLERFKEVNEDGNLLFNVGRGIIYSENPKEKAREYCERINNIYL